MAKRSNPSNLSRSPCIYEREMYNCDDLKCATHIGGVYFISARSDAEQKRHGALWRWWKFCGRWCNLERRARRNFAIGRSLPLERALSLPRLHASPWAWKWALALKMERQFASFICARPANGCWIYRARWKMNRRLRNATFIYEATGPGRLGGNIHPPMRCNSCGSLLMASCISDDKTALHVICNKAASLWSLGVRV